jgi:uncharacterized 2Fe-2S/4Fe-4S cluster protein (DUF4445 family)
MKKSNPLAFPLEIVLEKPSDLDKKADRERLLDAVSQALSGSFPLDIDLEILRRVPSLMREQDFSLQVVIALLTERLEVVAAGQAICYGIAIDLGTTNLVASLFDLKTYQKIDSRETVNPQTSIASDVLSRIYESMKGRGEELHRLMVEGVNTLIGQLCAANGVDSQDIFALAVAGNTIMTHYFLNLPVENIPMAPYVPAAHKPGFINPSLLGIAVNPKATAYVFPNVGSYVGGDIVSGILASGLYQDREPSLLIDVGTNVEIVLGCNEWIIVGAGAAGPALEGDIAGIGMRAEEGAIYEIEIEAAADASGKQSGLKYRTVGGRGPSGICGSGMIELVSELFRNGIIDQRGKFATLSGRSGRIIEWEGNRGFEIHDGGGEKLLIKETEINNFLRSKAALFTSIHILIKSVGLNFSDLKKVYVCGAFGAHINVDKAISIGMLPDIDRERFVILGNSSLAGTEKLLGDRGSLPEIDWISSLITYREMNTDGDFQREFPGAMFLPHTDPEVLKAKSY